MNRAETRKRPAEKGKPPEAFSDHVETRHRRPLAGQTLGLLLDAARLKGAGLRFTAFGASMHPFIRNGDVVTVGIANGRNLDLGDVVAVRSPVSGNLVLHRVVARRGRGRLRIKADNTEIADGWVDPSEVLGSVQRVERNGRRVRIGTEWGKRGIAILSRNHFLPGCRSIARRLATLWKNAANVREGEHFS